MANNVTIKTMDSLLGNHTRYFDHEIGAGVTIQVRRMLTLAEKSVFVRRVVNAVVDEGRYNPEYLDVAFFTTFLQMATNVNVPEQKNHSAATGVKTVDVEHVQQWMAVCRFPVWQLGEEDANWVQYADLYSACHSAIEHRKSVLENTAGADMLLTAVGKYLDMAEQFGQLTEELGEETEQNANAVVLPMVDAMPLDEEKEEGGETVEETMDSSDVADFLKDVIYTQG